jgi:hypothetical protein
MTVQLNDPTPHNAALTTEDGAAGRSPTLESLSGLKEAPSGTKTAEKKDYVDRQPLGRRGCWRLDDLSPAEFATPGIASLRANVRLVAAEPPCARLSSPGEPDATSTNDSKAH